MKLHELTDMNLHDSFSACKMLLDSYEHGSNGLGGCPLCFYFNNYNTATAEACTKCPWTIFTGLTCNEYAPRIIGEYAVRSARVEAMRHKTTKTFAGEQWRKARIEMLREWISELAEEIGRRGN